jgi:hypothetical protein
MPLTALARRGALAAGQGQLLSLVLTTFVVPVSRVPVDNFLAVRVDRTMLKGMRFDDLPSDWAQRPITDHDLFEGVIDLVVTDRSRAAGTLHVLLCHANGRLMQQVSIGEHPDDPAEVMRGLSTLLTNLADIDVRHVVIVIARSGPALPTPHDHDLRAAFEGACRTAGADLLGVAVAGVDDVVALPGDETRNSAA